MLDARYYIRRPFGLAPRRFPLQHGEKGAWMRPRSNSALCGALHNADHVEREIMQSVWPLLDERARRLMAASEAKMLGYGGISLVQRASGLSRRVIASGIREIAEGVSLPAGRIRRLGGGRKPLVVSDPQIVEVLDSMIRSHAR
jgi:hypothetical protein